ncbi:MAG: hypothetical protein M0Z77_07580 [Thermoplasmatales archaeon]|nr:hypothetical protein [Thermoplasmatales archaeon]
MDELTGDALEVLATSRLLSFVNFELWNDADGMPSRKKDYPDGQGRP